MDGWRVERLRRRFRRRCRPVSQRIAWLVPNRLEHDDGYRPCPADRRRIARLDAAIGRPYTPGSTGREHRGTNGSREPQLHLRHLNCNPAPSPYLRRESGKIVQAATLDCCHSTASSGQLHNAHTTACERAVVRASKWEIWYAQDSEDENFELVLAL